MSTYVYLRDRVVHVDEAGISPLEPSFLYGSGLFETVRVREGVPLRMFAHVRRLRRGLTALGCDPSYLPSVRRCREAVRELVQAEGVPDVVARITASAGDPGLAAERSEEPWLLVHLAPLPGPCDPRGVELAYALTLRDPRNARFGLKATSYLENRLDLGRAQRLGAFDALYRNLDGTVAECTRANVFFAIGGRLVTPSLDSGVLPGVLRQSVIRAAARAGKGVEERKVAIEEIASASECFVTNAVRGVVSVASVEETAFSGCEWALALSQELEAEEVRDVRRFLARAGRRGPARS